MTLVLKSIRDHKLTEPLLERGRSCHGFLNYNEEETDRCQIKWQIIKKEGTITAETQTTMAPMGKKSQGLDM